MFPDYERDMPDDLTQIGHEYLKTRKTNSHNKKTDDIKTWEDAYLFMNDENNISRTVYDIVDQSDRITDKISYMIKYGFETHKDLISKFYTSTYNKEWDPEWNYNSFYDYMDEIHGIDIEDDYDFMYNYSNFLITNAEHAQFINMDYFDDVISWIHNDEHLLYRSMTIPSKLEYMNDVTESGVGVYWSYAEDGAEAHSGQSYYNEIILTCSVEPEDIEWENTLHKSLYDLSDEKEIELKPNTTIDLHSFELRSTHPLVQKLYNDDIEYLTKIGINNPYKIVKNKGTVVVNFEKPIIVST